MHQKSEGDTLYLVNVLLGIDLQRRGRAVKADVEGMGVSVVIVNREVDYVGQGFLLFDEKVHHTGDHILCPADITFFFVVYENIVHYLLG